MSDLVANWSDLVANPEDRFSHDKAHIQEDFIKTEAQVFTVISWFKEHKIDVFNRLSFC